MSATRAELKALELLRSVMPPQDAEMYEELGFVCVAGRQGRGGYAYLVYPHRPLIAYELATGRLLAEFCVSFGGADEPPLPDADDLLARWMSLRAAERRLVGAANRNPPGRQVDPDQARADLTCLEAWRTSRGRPTPRPHAPRGAS